MHGILNRRRTAVVGEDSRVTSSEVKGTSLGVTQEDSRASLAVVEVQPLLSLVGEPVSIDRKYLVREGLTFGCQ